MKANTPEEAEHQKRMKKDANYAANFLANSIPEGTTFTVTLQCRNRLESAQLYKALEDQSLNIAGCRVQTVFKGDVAGEYMTLQNALRKLLPPWLQTAPKGE